MFQVQSKVIVFFGSFLRAKVVGEILEILDRVSHSPIGGSDQQSSSQSQQCDPSIVIFMKTRAHELRLSNWNGSMEKLPSKTSDLLL